LLHIISEFNFKDFKLLKNKIDFENNIIFTNDTFVKETLSDLGIDVKHIVEHYDVLSPQLYPIHEQSIKQIDKISKKISHVEKNHVSLFDALYYKTWQHFLFLKTIEFILRENKQVVFIFNNIQFFYFIIPLIAKKLNHRCDGVYSILDGELRLLDYDTIFHEKMLSLEKGLENAIINNEKPDNNVVQNKNLLEEIKKLNPDYAFFLQTNQYELQIKPMYPLLDSFRKEKLNFIIFTYTSHTTQFLEKRGFKVINLSEYYNQRPFFRKISSENTNSKRKKSILSFNLQGNDLILLRDFFYQIETIVTDDYQINHYLKYLKTVNIISQVIRSLNMINIIESIFRNTKLLSIILTGDPSPENKIACRFAEKYKIPSFCVPNALTRFTAVSGMLYNASKIFVHGTWFKKEFQRLGINENRMIITGNPRYDYAANVVKQRKSSKKLVVVAMSRWRQNDEDWMSKLVKFCNDRDFEIKIKVHPMYKFGKNEESENKINKIKEKCVGLNYKITYDEELEELIPKTDVLIIEQSNIGIEALLQNIPIIVAKLGNEKFYDDPHCLLFHKENVAPYATTFEELKDFIEKIICEDKELLYNLSRSRERFLFDINYINDGKATERIFQEITKKGFPIS